MKGTPIKGIAVQNKLGDAHIAIACFAYDKEGNRIKEDFWDIFEVITSGNGLVYPYKEGIAEYRIQFIDTRTGKFA